MTRDQIRTTERLGPIPRQTGEIVGPSLKSVKPQGPAADLRQRRDGPRLDRRSVSKKSTRTCS
jgi:hypothetical protein